jgi:hypothetical protein
MSPLTLLSVLILLTAAGVVIDGFLHKKRQRVYRQLASEHQMHYSPRDPLRLTPRVAGHLPVPGAAAVRVTDLLYRTDDQSHHYVFTAEYSVGVAASRHRHRRVVAFSESKTQAGDTPTLRLAPVELPLLEQYRRLIVGGSAQNVVKENPA